MQYERLQCGYSSQEIKTNVLKIALSSFATIPVSYHYARVWYITKRLPQPLATSVFYVTSIRPVVLSGKS